MEEKYIAALDVGTTTVRCYIFNSRAEIIGKSSEQVILHYPEPGYVEIDPDELWSSITKVITLALQDGGLTAGQLACMGLSTQRGTFITWCSVTGRPFHRFITWKDLRADKLVKQWNDSFAMKGLRAGSMCLFLMSRSKRFRAGSVLKLMNTQTTLRLAWALDNEPDLKRAVADKTAMFGTLDTWLLHRLTGGRLHVTDTSSASATGFFDPFTLQWAGWALTMFGIPTAVLPTVVDTAGTHFTHVEADLFGAQIPIISSMADQTASMWGSCCFEAGDAKLTLGTGTFLNINTGGAAHASVAGLYPLVGWQRGTELLYAAEGSNNDTGSIVQWAQAVGLFENAKDTASIANSIPNSDGVYFVPAFSGLGPPINDSCAGAGFIGLRAISSRAHLVRALLEALAFRTHQLIQCARQETHYRLHTVRVDGGVSSNDFLLQLLADLCELDVERPVHTEMSALGCAFLSGLQLGIWKSKEELKSLYRTGRVFKCRPHVLQQYKGTLLRWNDAVERFRGWYAGPASRRGDTGVVGDSSLDINVSKQNGYTIKEAQTSSSATKGNSNRSK